MSNVEVIGSADIEKIKAEIGNASEGLRQFPLQGAYENDFKGARGPIETMEYEEEKYTYPLYIQEMPYIYSLIEQYNLFRTRVLTIPYRQNYAYHQDQTPRIHIPLQSNEDCMMIVDDQLYRLPADGSVYRVDTTRYHLALNANLEPFYRIHVVGNIKN